MKTQRGKATFKYFLDSGEIYDDIILNKEDKMQSR